MMAHHARYPRLVSRTLPEALRRAIYDRHRDRFAARLTKPGVVNQMFELARTDPEIFPLYHNGVRRWPKAS